MIRSQRAAASSQRPEPGSTCLASGYWLLAPPKNVAGELLSFLEERVGERLCPRMAGTDMTWRLRVHACAGRNRPGLKSPAQIRMSVETDSSHQPASAGLLDSALGLSPGRRRFPDHPFPGVRRAQGPPHHISVNHPRHLRLVIGFWLLPTGYWHLPTAYCLLPTPRPIRHSPQ